MAKKNSNVPKALPVEAVQKSEELSLENTPDSASSSEGDSEDFSSDEDIDVQGLEEELTTKKSAHTVKLTKESKKSEGKIDAAKQRAVIYVGRLPKLFEEKEMKKYFSQFGDITRVRVSRNKVTGASRHYAFVEFKDLHAAQVAAETMNNYLLVGHLLKVHLVENPKENLFSKNMKSSFREFDWRAKEYEQQNAPKPLETWKELQKKYEESKKQKFSELKKLGFDYALEA
ncbi:RNA-binding domain-containing protein [Metschnikowia bicuspidata var. bicuspidata NRRL YB-4993]|uniref:RNA-binding domain-containing protein n=1 Tax=Metschnikowia bicuspidata var. bicuspidata NRRL YB-4993 TaxID=869754 RepID=A0A1A0HJ71_9ASCO|nr:RNA-binding domain-containing protein [Metschnikowia bicuspidata var. bicuspidata NRRL YB-4993]OBA23888.1 RNA-binding domain-containing protein [Metschnikowia bicuspidata var. bicuspidata NRRL YB-4993]